MNLFWKIFIEEIRCSNKLHDVATHDIAYEPIFKQSGLFTGHEGTLDLKTTFSKYNTLRVSGYYFLGFIKFHLANIQAINIWVYVLKYTGLVSQPVFTSTFLFYSPPFLIKFTLSLITWFSKLRPNIKRQSQY